MGWSANSWDSWSIWASHDAVGIESPLANAGSKTLARGEQLVFIRNFEGVPERRRYCEILQRFVHSLGLHYLKARDAWCRLDRHGDIEDIIKVVRINNGDNSESIGKMVLFDRAELLKYSTLTEAVLLRMFDFAYTDPNFTSWNPTVQDERTYGDTIRYRYSRNPGAAAYARGIEIVPFVRSRQAIINEILGRDDSKQYASFIAVDWKNERIEEISCSPEATANYFKKSDKPFDTTPAFFRPEVLLKYKGDREKYSLDHRSVGCRGAWYLKTFDINAEGQVHTYLVYLRALPYEEQLHWKQYNEQPKGWISKRAFRTDFQGERSDYYDPLIALKLNLESLDSNVPWWRLRNQALMDKAHYPVTSSPDEWEDEILHLDQLLVEGFEEKWLRTRSANPDLRIHSLGLLEECLRQYGFDGERAREILKPLRDLHELRSKVKGHAPGAGAEKLRRNAIEMHGSLREHYWKLAQKCEESLKQITLALNDPC